MSLDAVRHWIDSGQLALAERELRRHLAGQPADGVGHALLAIALVCLHRDDEALEAAREAVRLDPHHPATVQALAEVHVRGEKLTGEATVRRALELFPAEPVYHALLAASLMQRRARGFRATRLAAAALKSAEAGLALDPRHAGCMLQRTQALLRLGRVEEARAASEATLRNSPGQAAAHVVHASVERAAGNAKAARRSLRAALRADPTDEHARQGLRRADEWVRLAAAITREAEEPPVWLRVAAALLTLSVACAIMWGHEADTLGFLVLALFCLFSLEIFTLPMRFTLRGRARMDELRVPGALTEEAVILTRAFMILMIAIALGCTLLASVHEPPKRTGAPHVWHLPWNHSRAPGAAE